MTYDDWKLATPPEYSEPTGDEIDKMAHDEGECERGCQWCESDEPVYDDDGNDRS